MKKEVPTWLWGCGIGCGALVLLCVAGAVAVGLFFKNTTSGFASAAESRKALESRFGQADEFAPWPDGVIPGQRLEAFLAVREATEPERERIARTFAALPTTPEEAKEIDNLSGWEKFKKSMSIARDAIGLGGSIGRFFEARNQALLSQEMGMGEYTYLYVTTYYGWLKKPPNDGLTSGGRGVKIDTGHFQVRVRDRMLKMLQRQWESAPEGPWKDRLAAELEAFRGDPERVPWRDGLPEPLASSLEPYRQRLEQTYNPVTNEFELGLNRSRGWGSYTLE